MGIVSPYPKPAGVYHVCGPSNKYRHQWQSYNNCFDIISNTVSSHHQSKSPIQNRLPLQSPKWKYPLPHKTINPQRARAPTPTPTTTSSDVLCLMDSLRLPISPDIYASLVKECTITRDAARAAELHAHINRSRLRPGLPLLNRLLLMYVSCGRVDIARQVFDEMTLKDFSSWATMIAGYVDNGDYEEAVKSFVAMLQHHDCMLEFPPWIIVWVLKACVNTMNMELGQQVHGSLLKAGTMNLFLSSSLINFYGKFKCLKGADFVFDQIPRRDTVIWTARIVNNCKEEHFDEVLNVFKEMGRAGIKKNHFTFSSVLRACARMKDDGQCGLQIHANAIKLGIESNIFVQCGLVDMYGKCGLLRDARTVFETIGNKRNAACWNAMLTGYIQHGFCIEAVKFLYQMKAAGMQPQESLLNEVQGELVDLLEDIAEELLVKQRHLELPFPRSPRIKNSIPSPQDICYLEACIIWDKAISAIT